MGRKKTINGAAFQMEYAANYIVNRYTANNYICQKLSFDYNGNPGMLVQICNTGDSLGGKLKTVVGLQSCATLKLQADDNDLIIEVMAGKWLDKIAVNVVSWFVLCPLFVTSAIGVWKQKKLLDQLFIDTLGFFAGA